MKWSTLSEINNDYFLIEKSNDAIIYKSISKVKGNNNVSGKRDYSVLDNSPFKGVNYYRLTQVDKDGKFTSYGILKINGYMYNVEMRVYPNPIKNKEIDIIFNDNNTQKKNITITDMLGRVILKQGFMQQGSQLSVPLSVKPDNGIYILQIEGYLPVKLIVN